MINHCNKSFTMVQNPITQVAGMPYALYLSLQGNLFIGSTDELKFGNGKNAWAGLINPIHSGVNLHIYFWGVSNTGETPIRAQFWFNAFPPGSPKPVETVTPTNTALFPPPITKMRFFQASQVNGLPDDGIKAFVRRATGRTTISDVELGKFIMPPGGSFIIFLGTPENPNQPGSATVSYTWFEMEA